MSFEYSQSCVVEGTVVVETVVGTVGLGMHSLKFEIQSHSLRNKGDGAHLFPDLAKI